MERRLLLVFALTFLVIVLSQPILKKYLPQAPAPTPQTQEKPQTQAIQQAAVAVAQAEAARPGGTPLNPPATKQAAAES